MLSPLLIALSMALHVPAANTVKIAVLPLQPTLAASAEQAALIEGKLRKALQRRRGVSIIPAARVKKAMRDVGATDTVGCDTACLVRIGKQVRADRVIAPSLSLQKKQQTQRVRWPKPPGLQTPSPLKSALTTRPAAPPTFW